tara:strand:+ start:55 stop:879 length:825 start_codon:yes stop_codon:yes gene_type:complete
VENKNYKLPDGNIQISFSGGRTSAFMLHQILEDNNGLPDRAKVIFTNTGREMNETLDFVQECSERWNVNIIWLEYDIVDGKVTFKEVNHNSASRDGEPFEKLIRKYKRLPNGLQRYCTGKLKIQTANNYLKTLQWKKWSNALGIRHDEKHRAKTDFRDGFYPFYPLVENKDNIFSINKFWNLQNFKLNLPVIKGKTLMGNCDGCFLKSESHLATLFREYPSKARWWLDMEKLTGKQFNRDRNLSNFNEFITKQQDWVFDQQGYFCQTNNGECTG